MDIQNKIFEKMYGENAPDWSLERDPDGKYKYHATQSAFLLYEQQQVEVNLLKAELAKAQATPEQILKNDCMIGQTWFMKGTPVSALVKYAEDIYKAEAIAQNSKIEFGTDDNERWWAHDVPFYGKVQMDRIEEHGLTEWDIHFNDCWQGPFNSKSECIKHLEECIAERREEAQE